MRSTPRLAGFEMSGIGGPRRCAHPGTVQRSPMSRVVAPTRMRAILCRRRGMPKFSNPSPTQPNAGSRCPWHRKVRHQQLDLLRIRKRSPDPKTSRSPRADRSRALPDENIIRIRPHRACDQAISWRATLVDFRKRTACRIIPDDSRSCRGIESPRSPMPARIAISDCARRHHHPPVSDGRLCSGFVTPKP
jgi:hypothetical protein